MVTFNYTEGFFRQAKRLAKRYRSLADDINSLQHELKENPEIGVSLASAADCKYHQSCHHRTEHCIVREIRKRLGIPRGVFVVEVKLSTPANRYRPI